MRSPAAGSERRVGGSVGLRGARLSSLMLGSTRHAEVDLVMLAGGWLVIYMYPGGAGSPRDQGHVMGSDAVQHQAFARHRDDFTGLRCEVVGLSTQSGAAQAREVAAHGLEYELLSDPELRLAGELGLPTFALGGRRFYERLVLVVAEGRVEEVFCPAVVARAGALVTAWLRSRQ